MSCFITILIMNIKKYVGEFDNKKASENVKTTNLERNN